MTYHSIKLSPFKKWPFERDVLIHVLIGALASVFHSLVPFWALYIIFYEGTFKVLSKRNTDGQAHLAAAYLCGMELIMRMSRSGLPHELTKYGVIFILSIGLLTQPRFYRKSLPVFFFFLLQLPSIVLTFNHPDLSYARELLSFNLSGPLCLTISVIYFYHLRFNHLSLARLFRNFLLPITSTVTWLFLATPSVSDIEFVFGANFAASGYGPNQMSALLGAGMLFIGLGWLFQIPIAKSRIILVVLFAAFAYRGLLTFSRGGMLVPVTILAMLLLLSFILSRTFRKRIGYVVFSFLILSYAGYQVFEYTNTQTGNALANRYQGINYGKEVGIEKYSSGRLEIARIDWEIFLDHPLMGIGPGMGTDLRYQYGYHERTAAHVEFSRLLAEHGIFGLLALMILIFFPIREYFRRRTFDQRYLLIAGVLFCWGFMAHSATRIALPMMMYGFGFIYTRSK